MSSVQRSYAIEKDGTITLKHAATFGTKVYQVSVNIRRDFNHRRDYDFQRMMLECEAELCRKMLNGFRNEVYGA